MPKQEEETGGHARRGELIYNIQIPPVEVSDGQRHTYILKSVIVYGIVGKI